MHFYSTPFPFSDFKTSPIQMSIFPTSSFITRKQSIDRSYSVVIPRYFNTTNHTYIESALKRYSTKQNLHFHSSQLFSCKASVNTSSPSKNLGNNTRSLI